MTISIQSSLADIKAAKTSDLLAFYNAHRKPIVKFRDRATAEQRVADLVQDLAKTAPVATPAPVAVTPAKPPKTYFLAVRDHSGSMYSIARAAARDYNATIQATQRAAAANAIETSVTVIECGGNIRFAERNTPVGLIKPLAESSYGAAGGTPLFASVQEGINFLLRMPDANQENVNFIVMATTDGQDTGPRGGGAELAKRIRELQKNDRWTFVFRVPRGDARDLVDLGIEPGNILEWDQTERGVAAASAANEAAMADFFNGVTRGVRSTKTFYTSAANLTEADVQKLGDISGEVQLFPVSAKEDGGAIREFVENRLNGGAMLKGAAFYQLVKTEDKIQDYKLIAIRDKDTGAIYCGPEARQLIGLPQYGDARVRPDTAGKWQVFVQSTSVNRKVSGGTQLMYWPNVGKRFTEGKSAR